MSDAKNLILEGRTALGIEFGSTRIKAVLADENNKVLAQGNHDWENRFENGIWTYSQEDIWTGLQDAYANMAADVKEKYDVTLTTIGAIGFSAMMHGYLPFDKDENLLVPFRTWRNTITEQASLELTKEFNFNIPQRWTICHLYQAILNGEEHVKDIDFLTTLEGYVHWQLSGQKVIGVGEAAGIMPLDAETRSYHGAMVEKFESLIAEKNYPWKLIDILPKSLIAGQNAGCLTEKGAALLDVSGNLKPGIPMCPPEGDAGTGMVATNSVEKRTANVSAGTSVFAQLVLEQPLKALHPEIDMVATPEGFPVAMVHCNNCTSDLNAWVKLFAQFTEAFGIKADMNDLYGTLYREALKGDADCGGLLAYNYFSGEHVTGFEEGRPMFVRSAESNFTLANFMRTHLFTSLGALKIGLDILLKEEGAGVDKMMGHGGLFKTPVVGQKILAAAVNSPVTVMATAGEGGAWGIAVLANYMLHAEEGEDLASYLNNKVFAGEEGVTIEPDAADVEGFNVFVQRYAAGLPIERAAVESLI